MLGYYYGFSTHYYNYTTPFSLILYIKLLSATEDGVIVSFGYNNGSGIIWYDNISIRVSNVTSAYMLIDGNNLTGARTFYDLELVFRGIDDGEYTFFKSLNASLGLQVELSLQTTVDLVA